MTPFLAEFLGTMLLLLLGNGVVANVSLDKTLGNKGGWLLINIGWGLAVFIGVFVAGSISGAHLNPAVTLGFAIEWSFDWAKVPGYLLAQFGGAAFGTFLVWLHYKPHYDVTEDEGAILGTFSTGPAIRKPFFNLISEIIGTFVLVFAAFNIVGAKVGETDATLGALDALPIALVVVVIGISLGGTTGYAINPARDLSPRLMHAILPIPGKGDSNWSYAWIPVIGPCIGAALAALVYMGLG
jgi:glycerol uptake facilitator protein